MSTIDKVRGYIETIEPLTPEFSVVAQSGRYVVRQHVGRIKKASKLTSLESLASDKLFENFDRKTFKYVIDVERTLKACLNFIHSDICTMYSLLSHAKKPKLTKAYRSLARMNDVTEAQESFVSLWLYYYDNRTDIETDSNSKHRQNILALLDKISTLY